MALLRFESYRTGLAASTVLNLASQAISFVTLILFAGYFGAQTKTDVYLFCASAVLLVAGLLTSLDAAVVIPETMRLQVQSGSAKAIRFFNCFFHGYLAVTVLLLAPVLLWPLDVLALASSFERELLIGHERLIRLTCFMLLGEVASLSLNNLLVAYRFFTMPMLSMMANRAVQIVVLLTLHDHYDILVMPMAVLAAQGLQILTLVGVLCRKIAWLPAMDLRLVHSRVTRNSGFALAGNVFSTLSQLAPLYLLSGFGAGVVSAVSYANRLITLPQNFLSQHVSSVAGIRLNELRAHQDEANFGLTFLRACRGLTFCLVPISVLIFLLAEPVVQVLFERGSFDPAATAQSSSFLRWLGLTLPLLGINRLTARMFMAAQQVVPAFWYQTAQNLLLIGMIILAIGRWGAIGYAYAVVGFYAWNVLAIWPLTRHFFPRVPYLQVLGHLLGIGVLNVALGVGVALVIRALAIDQPWLLLVTAGLLFATLLLVLQRQFTLSTEFDDVLSSFSPTRRSAATKQSTGPHACI